MVLNHMHLFFIMEYGPSTSLRLFLLPIGHLEVVSHLFFLLLLRWLQSRVCLLLLPSRPLVSSAAMSDGPTREQKLNIATYFVMSSPVGEVDEVVAGQPTASQQGRGAGREHQRMGGASGRPSSVRVGPSCAGLALALASVCCLFGEILCRLELSTHGRAARASFASRVSSPLPSPLSDVKKLVDDPSTLTSDALSAILRDYNTEQMTAAPAPGGVGNLLVTKYGQVGSNQYLDPNSGKVYNFNHASRTFGDETDKKQVLSETIEQLRATVQKALEAYTTDLYKANKATVVVYGADNGTITICLSAKNVNLSNYW